MQAIEQIQINGFKSIRKLELTLRPLNILIGANGAGKSNFIGAFKFLNELVNENLQVYVARSGGVDTFLYFGRQIIVVDREDKQSVLRHLPEDKIDGWLDDYGLGDLWEKNVLGGRPTP